MLAPRDTPEACWLSSTMPVVGLVVTSAGLASRKSSHALCSLPTAWKSLSFLIDLSLKGINLMQKKCCVKTAVLVNPALPTSPWELEKSLSQHGLGARANALGAGEGWTIPTRRLTLTLLVLASLLTWHMPR